MPALGRLPMRELLAKSLAFVEAELECRRASMLPDPNDRECAYIGEAETLAEKLRAALAVPVVCLDCSNGVHEASGAGACSCPCHGGGNV